MILYETTQGDGEYGARLTITDFGEVDGIAFEVGIEGQRIVIQLNPAQVIEMIKALNKAHCVQKGKKK